MHPRLHARLRAPGDTEQLDAVAQFVGEGDVERADPADAFDVHRREADGLAKGKGGQDGELVGGVGAVHVGRRVGFRVAERLGLGQHVRELAPLLAHGGEDVVAGAVEDAGDPADAVGRQALAQRLDDGNAAGNGRLEREGGGARQGGAVQGDQRLVGGDDGAAGSEGGGDKGAGRTFRAADQLHHGIDAGEGGEVLRVFGPVQAMEVQATVAGAVARADGGGRDGLASAGGDEAGVVVQQAEHAGADGAKAGDGDAHLTPRPPLPHPHSPPHPGTP